MAMYELLRKKEFEESKLKVNPNSIIAKNRLERFDKEIIELHEMIIKEELVTA